MGSVYRRPSRSGYQILAHFIDRLTVRFLSKIRRRFAEFPSENVGEMAMAGETEIESDRCEIGTRGGYQFKRCPQPQHCQIPMDRQARLLLEDTRKIKGRSVDRGRHIFQGHGFGHVS